MITYFSAKFTNQETQAILKKITDNKSIMKKMKHLITIAILLTISINSFGQVGIGTTTPLGALDVTSTNDGLVIP